MLVKLNRFDGMEIYVNPAWLSTVRPARRYERGANKYFHIAGHVSIEYGDRLNDKGELLCEHVLGTVDEVAAKLNGEEK